MAKTTKSPTYAVLPHRQEQQDVYFFYVKKMHGQLQIDEELIATYQRPSFPVGERDVVIELLTKAGITVRYFDKEESKWMDQSALGGLEPAPGNRDGSWTPPILESFKQDYLEVRFGAPVTA